MDDAEAARALLSAKAVRERAHEMLVAGLEDRLEHFTVDLESLIAAAQVVSELIRVNYPDLKVPFHARWRHFVLGAGDLWAERATQAHWPSPAAKARAEFDLAITSVLLDAGAGASWRYLDPPTEQVVSRSEGLAIASLRMFEAGSFSADPADPLRADAERLRQLTAEEVATGFQSMVGNRLVGIEGRASLLASLGDAVAAKPDVFAREDSARPGGLYDYLAAKPKAAASRRRASSKRCSNISVRSGRAASRSAACRSAIPGVIPLSSAPMPRTASCRSTSCRNGSPTR